MAVTKAIAKKLKGLLGDLDDSFAARSARARDQGFDMDTTYYKGMYPYDWTHELEPEITEINRKTGFPTFNGDGSTLEGIAGFLSPDPNVASRFAGKHGAVYPLRYRENKVLTIDAKGESAGSVQFGESGKEFQDAVSSGKYDTIKIVNTNDEGDILVSLDPKNIRSVNAMFDPAKKESSNLMAGMAGAAPIAGLGLLGSDEADAGSVLPPNTPNVGQRIEAPVNPRTEMAAGLLGGLNRRLENRGLGLLAPEGLENYLRKAAYGDEVTYLDRLFAALDVAP